MSGGDDTTPDPLFKNVPRRPRSAASWPRKEEPDGGDPGGIKRPASSTEHVPRAKKLRLLVSIEEPEPEDAQDRGVGALDRHGILGGNGKDKAVAAAASSASSSKAAEPAFDWAENERRRRRKGKAPVVNEDDDDNAYAAVARRPLAGSGLLGNKLMGDAIRSDASAAAAVAGFKPSSLMTKPKKPRTKPKKKTAKKDRTARPNKKDSSAWFWCGVGRDGMSSAGSDADYSFDRIGVVSDRLRTTLRNLGVAAPVRVYGRFLTRCDRKIQQTRLLMSGKRWRAGGPEFPLCALMTEGEKEEVRGEGLPLTVYDRGGDAYELTLRFLDCNFAYRLINKWSEFLRRNGLVVEKVAPSPPPPEGEGDDDVMLDLWMFRPPGGKVGMVMLHYRRGEAAHADAALDEVAQKKLRQKQRMLNNGAAAAAVMDEDGGVNGEMAAAAPFAPSSPSSESEPSGGGATEAAEAGGAPEEVAAASSSPSEPDGVGATEAADEQQAGALGEAADASPSSSPELHGTEEEEQMVLEVEAAATQSSLEANEVASPPSSPEQAGGGAAMMATTSTEEEDEDAADEAEVEAAARRSWNVTKLEFLAALGLVKLSKANINS